MFCHDSSEIIGYKQNFSIWTGTLSWWLLLLCCLVMDGRSIGQNQSDFRHAKQRSLNMLNKILKDRDFSFRDRLLTIQLISFQDTLKKRNQGNWSSNCYEFLKKGVLGCMSWTGPSNIVELFHGSLFCHVIDIFEVLLIKPGVHWRWYQFVV